MITSVLLVLVLLQVSPGADVVAADLVPVATFQGATMASGAPDGSVVVIDQARRQVVRVRGGEAPEIMPIGAAHPSGVDATSTLSLLISDGVEGTVSRYGRSGDLILRIAIPADVAYPGAGAVGFNEQAIPDAPGGEPGDVAEFRSGGGAAVESGSGGIYIWDTNGRPVGGVSSVAGAPFRASRIAVHDGLLYAVGGGGGHVFESDGDHERPLPVGLGSLTAVAAADGVVWVASDRALFQLSPEGDPVRVVGISPDAPIQDIAVSGDRLWVLTSSALYRVEPPE